VVEVEVEVVVPGRQSSGFLEIGVSEECKR
jgi:hypothetical protein